MTIKYYGRHSDYFLGENKYPIAVIDYQEAEEAQAEKVYLELRARGYNATMEDQIHIEIFGTNGYEYLLDDYKEIKNEVGIGRVKSRLDY